MTLARTPCFAMLRILIYSNSDSSLLPSITRWNTYSKGFTFHSGRKCQRTVGFGVSQERKVIYRQRIDLQIAVACVTPITNSHPRRTRTLRCVCTKPALQDKLSILLGTNTTVAAHIPSSEEQKKNTPSALRSNISLGKLGGPLNFLIWPSKLEEITFIYLLY